MSGSREDFPLDNRNQGGGTMARQRFGYQEFGLGVAVGVAAGSLIGILFAPQSGAATRENIRSRASDLRASAEELIDSAKKNLDLAATKIEGILGRQEKGLRRKLEKIRSDLENHLHQPQES